MRVLVATDDRTFAPSLVAAYEERGWSVDAGSRHLFARSQEYDLVHLHWPEELAGWTAPTQSVVDALASVLDWWRERTRIVATVHNLLPHNSAGRPLSKPLYSTVYRRAHAIGHFSRYSLERVTSVFEDLDPEKHVVHRPFLFRHLERYRRGREDARARLQVGADDFALLGFGDFRKPDELRLFQKAVDLSAARKRTLFAGRFPPERLPRRLVRRGLFELWLKRQGATAFRGFLPEAAVVQLFEAADSLLIVRSGTHLNSGQLPLAITMGTPIVAPRYGAYAEYLSGTPNELYEPGDSRDLARAIDRMAQKDSDLIRRANRDLASDWGWEKIVETYARKLGLAVEPSAREPLQEAAGM